MKKVNLILSLIGMGVSGIVVGVLIGYFTTKRVNRNQIPPRVHWVAAGIYKKLNFETEAKAESWLENQEPPFAKGVKVSQFKAFNEVPLYAGDNNEEIINPFILKHHYWYALTKSIAHRKNSQTKVDYYDSGYKLYVHP